MNHDEEDSPCVTTTTDFDGAVASIKFTFSTEDKAEKMFKEYTLEQALTFRKTTGSAFITKKKSKGNGKK